MWHNNLRATTHILSVHIRSSFPVCNVEVKKNNITALGVSRHKLIERVQICTGNSLFVLISSLFFQHLFSLKSDCFDGPKMPSLPVSKEHVASRI